MIYVDTGPLLARYLVRDGRHEDARRIWQHLAESGEPLFTSNFVLDEFFTLLGRRAGYSFAAERARGLYVSERLKILRPNLPDELKAVDLFVKFADQRVSFTDCVSFVLMGRYQIKRAFSFDQHFSWAGFLLL